MASKKKKHKPKTIFVKEEAPLLGRTGGYVKDPDYALGADSRYTTIPAHNRPPQLDQEYLKDEEAEHPPEPAAVYKDDLIRFGKDAELKKEQQELLRPLSTRLAALESVARRDQLRSIEKRIKQVERAMNEKAA